MSANSCSHELMIAVVLLWTYTYTYPFIKKYMHVSQESLSLIHVTSRLCYLILSNNVGEDRDETYWTDEVVIKRDVTPV